MDYGLASILAGSFIVLLVLKGMKKTCRYRFSRNDYWYRSSLCSRIWLHWLIGIKYYWPLYLYCVLAVIGTEIAKAF